jgi:hypothetical protein
VTQWAARKLEANTPKDPVSIMLALTCSGRLYLCQYNRSRPVGWIPLTVFTRPSRRREPPHLPRLTSDGTSVYKDGLHTCALVLNSTYPRIIHSMWKLTFPRGQDMAVGEG